MNANVFLWPLKAIPTIEVAVRVPFSSQGLWREYTHPTFALHQHGYHAQLEIEAKRYTIRPGDVTLTPPRTLSRYKLDETGYHWCIHFLPTSLRSKKSGMFKLPLHISLPGNEREITERMQSISELLRFQGGKKKSSLRAATVGVALQELLLRLALYIPSSDATAKHAERRSDTLLDAAKEHLDEHFHEHLEVADLARSSHLSRNYFSARFHERFGMTVDAYLLRRRMEMARHLLLTTPLPIKEIAFECGIPDPHYFNKLFRRSTGQSPTAYRSKHT